jgi:hypothetical protein
VEPSPGAARRSRRQSGGGVGGMAEPVRFGCCRRLVALVSRFIVGPF